MWEEVKDMRSPCAVMSWLSGKNQGFRGSMALPSNSDHRPAYILCSPGACQAGAATWRDIYIHWHGLVDSAVDKALTTTGLKVEEVSWTNHPWHGA